MSENKKFIPCPLCSTKIPFDPKELLQGKIYECPNAECDASVVLNKER